MNKVYLQIWEESERGWGVRPDGCSLHLTLSNRNDYLDKVYEGRTYGKIPHEYDRIVGGPFPVFISDLLFSEVSNKGSLRLMEYEMRNLLNMEEIIKNEKLVK